MKTLIRFSLVISGAVILGAMLLWLVDMRHTNAVAADQPVLPNPAATQGQPWQRIRPPVAISETQILLQTIILDVNLEKMAEMGIDFETSQASPSPASTKQTQVACIQRSGEDPCRAYDRHQRQTFRELPQWRRIPFACSSS